MEEIKFKIQQFVHKYLKGEHIINFALTIFNNVVNNLHMEKVKVSFLEELRRRKYLREE
jgi:hypothetical protein